MNPTVFAAIGIGSLLTLGLPHRPPAHASASTAADTTLASKLAGTWSVTRYDSSSKAGKKPFIVPSLASRRARSRSKSLLW